MRQPEPVALPVVDLGGLPEAAREGRRGGAPRRCPTSPSTSWRTAAARAAPRLAGDDHVLAFAVHHIVADEGSLRLLVSEVSAAYLDLARGRAPELPALPIRFRDFAGWQRDALRDEAVAGRHRLVAGAARRRPGVLRVPTDHPRPAVQSFRGSQEMREIPPALAGSLRELSVAAGGGLFPVFLTAFQILLGARARQEDFVVASRAASASGPRSRT